MLIAAHVHGSDERGKIIRRTLARYLNLLSVLTFQAVSTSVKKRFPTLDHVQEAGEFLFHSAISIFLFAIDVCI